MDRTDTAEIRRLGILSDTHNLLRPEVTAALAGVDAILHAGDIARPAVLEQLREIAPVFAVRGNADRDWAEALPPFLDTTAAGLRLYMTHRKKDLPEELGAYDLVVFGHSHQYSEQRQGHTLLLNPGSCGPRRFHQPITMALAEITPEGIRVTRLEFAHPVSGPKLGPTDVRAQVEAVVRGLAQGRGPQQTAARYGMDPERAEQIARLYLTHPGVTVDGILTKMGL